MAVDNDDAPESLTPEKYYSDRPSSRTPEEREQFYQRYLELSAPYFQAIEDAADKPWWSSEQERRELYFRRYRRASPAPPAASVRPPEPLLGGGQQSTPDSDRQRLREASAEGSAA